VITMMLRPCASANLKWRLLAPGFALSVTADRLAVWESADSVIQPFSAASIEVRASGVLSPGNITAWHYGGFAPLMKRGVD
jgi:hypothetical protein